MVVFIPNNGFYRQIIAGIAASLSAFVGASVFGWLVPTLPGFLSPESEIPMNIEEASWVVTVPELGNLLSAVPAAMLADTFGRKFVLLLTVPIMLIGWSIIIYFNSYWALVIARLIQSFAIGIVFTIGPMYCGEIADPKYRGAISSLFVLLWWCGYPYEFILDSLFCYNVYTYITSFTPLVFFFAFLWQPETPYYYLLRNDVDKAKKSLSWLHCTTETSINLQLERMKQSIDENKNKKMSIKELFTTPTNRKGTLILILAGFLRVFCGLVPLLSYSTETLIYAGDDFLLTPDSVTILVGVSIIVGTICSFFTVDLLGRLTILVISFSISGIIMFCIGTYYLLKSLNFTDISSFSWVPPIGLIVFCIVSSLGIFPVSVVYTSELFDSHTRASASSFMTIYTMFLGFLVLKFYFTVVECFGLCANFYLYAFTCFSGILLSLYVFPETKGKTFEQIRIELSKSIINTFK